MYKIIKGKALQFRKHDSFFYLFCKSNRHYGNEHKQSVEQINWTKVPLKNNFRIFFLITTDCVLHFPSFRFKTPSPEINARWRKAT